MQNVLPRSCARAYTVSDDASADQRYLKLQQLRRHTFHYATNEMFAVTIILFYPVIEPLGWNPGSPSYLDMHGVDPAY